ncbi:enoyl-(Acyl carrier protein) reductase domain-containing protein [Ditylenchus destructor]|nr:enoyl-(Acyl carrier protein) reductase domain-containing protein [Ditylenchus destructor]
MGNSESSSSGNSSSSKPIGSERGPLRALSDAIDFVSESKDNPVRSYVHEKYHETAAAFKSDKREDQANAQRHYVNRTGDGKMYDDKDDKRISARIRIMGDFSGKAVIVTGSSRGIGREVALAFGREGAFLTVHGQSKEKLDETLELLRLSGVEGKRIVVVLGPIQDEKIANAIVDETVKKFGRIDVLVNNAGTAKLEGEDPNTLKNYDHVFDVNVRSVMQLTNLAAPHLAKTKGNVINVSSGLAFKPRPMVTHYSMSKAALDHYTRNVANTLGAQGIRVNSVNPGVIRTDFRTRQGIPQDAEAKMEEDYTKNKIILGRFGEASEIAEVILFVASSKASYITGTTIVVDGGLLVHA